MHKYSQDMLVIFFLKEVGTDNNIYTGVNSLKCTSRFIGRF
jgi:hypothetical protein